MAVNEIFELNSMFIGDDRERNELEQRSRTLRTAIDQQEGRVSKFIILLTITTCLYTLISFCRRLTRWMSFARM